MKLTPKLKSWAIKHTDVEADAGDADIKQAVAGALLDGSLTAEKHAELSKTPEDDEANGVKELLTGLTKSIGELRDVLVADDTDEKSVKSGKKKPPMAEDEDEEMMDEDDMEDKSVKTEVKEVKTEGEKSVKAQPPSALEKMVSSLAGMPSLIVDDGEKSLSIRVKEAAESYSDTKSAMVYPTTNAAGRPHPQAGRPVKDFTDEKSGGRPMNNPSELDLAVVGAYSKFLVKQAECRSKNLAFASLPDHDRELLLYAMEKMAWGGATNGASDKDGNYADIKNRRLSPREQKALIDDSTSGGLEAAPIVFDDMIISTPLLNGELFPEVNTISLDRGRRVEAAAVSNVTASWGGVDDTAISLFNTASYVTAFDTTIFRWEGAINIGLDFMNDTPIDFAQVVTGQYGERLLEDLDDVIATGNGTTQPEGVTVKSGTTSVNFGGSTTLSAYESLRFGVAKPEHKSRRGVFCGSETSYQRAKGIPVGASDARRLSDTVGMPNYGDYSWMGVPYKINESLANTKIFYAILSRYRMYRRRGLTMRTSTEGATLIRANEMIIACTARFGGHLERGAVAAVTSTAPA